MIGNETMLGQIPTFMDNLKMSYSEVYEQIPYRNLVLMQKDKLHSITDDTILEVSSTEMFGDKLRK